MLAVALKFDSSTGQTINSHGEFYGNQHRFIAMRLLALPMKVEYSVSKTSATEVPRGRRKLFTTTETMNI